MAKKNKSPFPKELLITHHEPENSRDEAYLMTHEDGLSSVDYNHDGIKIAVYKLVEVKTLQVRAALVAKERK